MTGKLGFSGRMASAFYRSQITPLLALSGLLLGVFAVLVTPREEEPQINVTFANVFVNFPGATAVEVEHLVSTPAEQVLSEIEGVKHVYSVSLPGRSVLTVQFEVGEKRTEAIVRLYNAIFSNQDWLPPNSGIDQPIVKPKGIDDVPIVSLNLWSEQETYGSAELQQVAHAIEAELKRVPGTRDIYTIGGPDRVVHVIMDPVRMAGFNVDGDNLRRALQAANNSLQTGPITRDNKTITVQAGAFLSSPEEIAHLVIGMDKQGAPVYLNDVAVVHLGPDQPERYAWFGTGPQAATKGIPVQGEFPSVTIAIAKKPGTNAATIATDVIDRIEQLKGTFIPDNVHVTVTRNYGATADDKAVTLIDKLIFATGAVIVLVLISLGWREAIIVGVAVIITLAITLFASWAWGFTLNRVSLFALIFSIGILVDDAIVVVENIHRHMQKGTQTLLEVIPVAVDEVGGPTILATFTVIAALLPMAFVSGLMGPYMSPIPINASLGMFISLAIAFIVTPWFAYKLLHRHKSHTDSNDEQGDPRMIRFFTAVLGRFLNAEKGRGPRLGLYAAISVLIIVSVGLVVVQAVILKMLPFDNKSEFQIIVDMPEDSSLEKTAQVLSEIAAHVATIDEVTDYQAYAGTASPINFNGLVRQYYLRDGPYMGDIQVNLVDKKHRHRKSHTVAASARPYIQAIGEKHGARVKIVEVPPGPPVMSPLVAEVYGIDYPGQRRLAEQLRVFLQKVPTIVDVDSSVEQAVTKWQLLLDRNKADMLGINQAKVVSAIHAAYSGDDVGFMRAAHVKFPLPIRLEYAVADKADLNALLTMPIQSQSGESIPLGDILRVQETTGEQAIYHKDLLPVSYVTADVTGKVDSPLYGMFDAVAKLNRDNPNSGRRLEQHFIAQPQNPYNYSIKWDGEWQVTYETFRDMGIAYSVGILLIYLLTVAQFRSYVVPLIIMAPIPLTIIGVLPGHALLGAQFTATSMIGMIALAGIIVRNSILLVDFIGHQLAQGMAFDKAVISAGAVRTKPIVLTGLAAMLGAVFILDDPIFNGLAVTLIFGIFISTVLTLIVIPVLYYATHYKSYREPSTPDKEDTVTV